MAILPEDPPLWQPSERELEACDRSRYQVPLGNSPDDHLVVSMTTDQQSLIVVFALVQRARHQGEWYEVAEIDSRHGTIHKHQSARSTGQRTGNREVIKELRSKEDVQDGYSEVYPIMLRDWQLNRERWERG